MLLQKNSVQIIVIWSTGPIWTLISLGVLKMGEAMTVMGGCLCGRVRFKCSGEIVHSLVCHCRMCQRASGSSFAGIMFFPSSAVEMTAGETRTYGSSSSGIRHFCAHCGSSLFFQRVSSDLHGILIGALDDPGIFKPTMHICLSAKQEWLDLADGLPGHEEKPAGMTPTGTYDSVTGQLVEQTA